MSVAIIVNFAAVIALVMAFLRDRKKAAKSLRIAAESTVRILPTMLAIVVLIGLLLGFVPPEQISEFVGERSGIGGCFSQPQRVR